MILICPSSDMERQSRDDIQPAENEPTSGLVASPALRCPYLGSSPTLSTLSLPQVKDVNAIMAPFRQIAFDHLPPTAEHLAAPTVVDASEWDTHAHLGSKKAPPSELALQAAARVNRKLSAHSEKHAPLPCNVEVPTGAVTHFTISAQVVNVYNVGPSDLSTLRSSTRSEQEDTVFNANAKEPDSQKTQITPWEVWKPTGHYDHQTEEKSLFPPSPRVYPVIVDAPAQVAQARNLDDIPVVPTEPPEFMDNDHMQAIHESSSHVHAANSFETGSQNSPDASSASSEGDSHKLDDEVLLDPRPRVCPEGKEDCTCEAESIELFKNAAAYLYKHSRTLSKEFFQAHVHVGGRIAQLQQINALNGGPSLPSSVHDFLQTETSQLLQDWAIVEAKCGQYMCDCILANVNGVEGDDSSEPHAKAIPPDFFKPDKNDSEATKAVTPADDGGSGTFGTDSLRSQCSERFAELKKGLLALTERSERVKKQWANLLDLCNKLDEVAQTGRQERHSDHLDEQKYGDSMNALQIDSDWYGDERLV